MITRQSRRPYLRSPYIREQLEDPKQQLADALELIDAFREVIGEAWSALHELTEESSENQRTEPSVVRKPARTTSATHA